MTQFRVVSLPYLDDVTPYASVAAQYPHPVWLDSGKPYSSAGRYDIIAAAPYQRIYQSNNTTYLEFQGSIQAQDLSPLTLLQHSLNDLRQTSGLNAQDHKIAPFMGGAIGYWSYEFLHGEFGLAESIKETFIPPTSVGLYHWAVVVDHKLRSAKFISLATCPPEQSDKLVEQLNHAHSSIANHYFASAGLSPDTSKTRYLNAIAQLKEYIQAGDCYQVNYTQRFSGDFEGSAFAAYVKLRSAMPNPYSCFLELDDSAILSLSPEQFIATQQRQACSRPIKGTTKRKADLAADNAGKQALLASDKNRAENLMIVDLLRNDFSQACQVFSVKVPELFKLESFANVHHLVSTITGELQPDKSPLDLFHYCFPGGSITGAPKRRSMEIIADLEPCARSIYCGSIGYYSINDHFDSNIAIRTLLQHKNKMYCWGGGGIVADSEAEQEYQESIDKIDLLLQTLVQ